MSLIRRCLRRKVPSGARVPRASRSSGSRCPCRRRNNNTPCRRGWRRFNRTQTGAADRPGGQAGALAAGIIQRGKAPGRGEEGVAGDVAVDIVARRIGVEMGVLRRMVQAVVEYRGDEPQMLVAPHFRTEARISVSFEISPTRSRKLSASGSARSRGRRRHKNGRCGERGSPPCGRRGRPTAGS